MPSGAFIPFAELAEFTPPFQAEFMQWIQAQVGIDQQDDIGPTVTDETEEPADLSVAQARKFLERVSDKVRTTVRVIADASPSGFDMTAVMTALDVDDASELRGVWGGITKRTRTVLGDSTASLIWWTEKESGGWVGRVSVMTHRSLQKALGI
jgi:hypothetical protein